MAFVDYYDTMGVAPDIEAAELKRVYRKLARQYHPDVSEATDAEERFKAIGEAWAVLKDPERRAEYDALREQIASGRAGGGAGRGAGTASDGAPWRSGPGDGADPFAGGFTDADASDFFRDIFGARAAAGGGGFGSDRSGAYRGEDAHVGLSIDLATAFAGAQLPLTLRVPSADERGQVELSEKTLKVRIPPGTLPGRKLRLAGQGGPGIGGAPAGDLYIEISVEPDPRFTLDGRDVSAVLDIAPWDAALGARLDVPTLGGDVQLRVAEGSTGGKRLRLKGRGMPGDPPGDHYIVLRIRVPAPRDDDERAAWQALRDRHENTTGEAS